MVHDKDDARSDGAVMPITTAEAERLYAALSLDQPVDPGLHDIFRHEMFAGRIRAAEFGREDAARWAREWLADLDKVAVAAPAIEAPAMAAQKSAAPLAAHGVAENPRYEAFLDTLEDPAALTSNAEYFIWMNARLTEFKQQSGMRQGSEGAAYQDAFTAYIRSYADRNLSRRAGAESTGSKERTVNNCEGFQP